VTDLEAEKSGFRAVFLGEKYIAAHEDGPSLIEKVFWLI
jgi:hypothetical protein